MASPSAASAGNSPAGKNSGSASPRAIFRQAPILILDEATSQVDAESEQLIQKAIDGLLHERTTFVIAHRFSTIKSADSIVVMDRGKIVGQGKHEELLETCEIYRQLYEGQLGGAGA
jgi:ABC-type multidrug transport system fused ATPase/permease subunit